jgi:uncharacterized protein YdaU (DUF1376 family)
MHYYQHNIGDYRRDTAHLSLLEHGIYRTLLDLYYLNETPIPKETDWVIRRLSAKTNDEILAIQAVLKDFFIGGVDGYRHRRCDMEIREYTAKADTARHNGKLGGRPKKTQSVISGMQETTEVKANQEPITINQEPKGERAKALTRPDDVDLQVWSDWVQLRKAKKAPVTETVLKTARKEAGLAGMTLMAFLEVWCARGSQGLEAAWLRADDKPSKFAKPEITATVPSKPGRDPEILKAENDLKNRAPMPESVRALLAKTKTGATA